MLEINNNENQKSLIKKKGDLNFKKWLLSLSSIGNLILGGLLFIMGISAMRFNLDRIFVADRGLISIGFIIILSSILCFIGIYYNSFIILLMVFYNYVLTMVFLSVFALGAVTMNNNLIDWIDNHWDIIRSSVFSYDMNKFKNHVTTEINSLGIFSLTLNAIIVVALVCISNFLNINNIIFALSPITNLIFSVLSAGLIAIGIYAYDHASYTSIPTWSFSLIIILGVILVFIGIFGYYSNKKYNKKLMILHLFFLGIVFVFLVLACFGVFNASGIVMESLNEHWAEISKELNEMGYIIRKSYLINQIQINLKLTGFYTMMIIIFSGINFATCYYQYYNINNNIKI